MSNVRPARHDDIAELVRLRAVLFAELAGTWGPAPGGDAWRDACAAAIAAALADEAMWVVVVDADTGLACCGMGVIDRRLPTPFNPSGLIGHIFGIVTDPAHRHHGHATAVMRSLLGWFDQHGLTRVDLSASPDGERLYRSLGFADHPDPVLSRTQDRGRAGSGCQPAAG